MNFKTTLSLAFLLIILVLGLYIVRSSPRSDESELTPTMPTAGTTRNLIDEDALGDPVKVICKQPGEDDWVFEKIEPDEGGNPVWHMTAPMNFKAISWEVDKFDRQVGGLKYEISYEPGEAGAPTPAEAGLDPPQAEVTLVDGDDKSVTVEIGKPASQNTTYVRLADTDRICVGQANLRNLFKSDPIEYRNRELFRFEPDDATRLAIVDRSGAGAPVTHVFRRDGGRWMMEAPVTSRVTTKVADAVRALSSLNAVGWVAGAEDRLSVYGLDAPQLTATVTVEETIVPEPEADADEPDDVGESADEEQPEPETVIHTYVLHISELAPIGEDTKRFARIDDATAVATVMKATADKLRPVMTEWREMQIVATNVNAATRVEISTPTHSTVLVRDDGAWQVEGQGANAESSTVTELLDAVRDLEAVAFVEPGADELPAMGFDDPRVDIRLTVPGVEGTERITVGTFSDPATKRLVYVRYNEAASVAKVRAEDVETLLRDPHSYVDHTILSIPSDEVTKLVLSAPEPCTGERLRVAFERVGGEWKMTAPISDAARTPRLAHLINALSSLRAESVVSEAGELSAFGLHDPAVTVSITRQPPSKHRIESADEPAAGSEGDDDEDAAPDEAVVTTEVPQPPKTWELLVTEHDGKHYAMHRNGPLVYAVSAEFYAQLRADYRTDRLLEFDPETVARVTLQNGNATNAFERRQDTWVYAPEPDLPIDGQKINDLLARLGDLRAVRFVRHGEADLQQFGLAHPARSARITLTDGSEHVLQVSHSRCDAEAVPGFYATGTARPGVAVLSPKSADTVTIELDKLEQ